jgi:predicted ATPase/ATP/maltotriose-dependent transcriptional regulator MalT
VKQQQSSLGLAIQRADSVSIQQKKSAVKHNLPIQPTPLVGREQTVMSACRHLQRPDVRLLTLTGPAGVGKTRLALQVATELLDDFADGVFFVPLASLRDPDLVVPTIAHTLELQESPDLPFFHVLKAYLQDRHVLLLLDNFEQVLPAGSLLAELLSSCPDLKLLVTSRAMLHLRAEYSFLVPPLALPTLSHFPALETLAQYAAISLFTQRAQAINPDFVLTHKNARSVVEICARLDGLPLAIELAAARIKLLPPKALLTRLSQRLHVLTSGTRDVPERQQTLRNAITWSYHLLHASEQHLFRRLSVFVGGCTLDTVEAVCGTLGDAAEQILDEVAALIDMSLLRQVEQEGEEPRLAMLETIREFGLEVLEASGEMEDTRRAHATYYLGLAEEAEPELVGPQQVMWLEQLEEERENLRAAMQWSLESGENGHRREMALRLGGALRRFWIVHGHFTEGRNFLERALAESNGVPASVQVKALTAAANLANMQTDNDRAEALAEKSRALCQELGDKQGLALSLRLLSVVEARRGNLATSHSLNEKALALFREVDDKEGAASTLNNLGWLLIVQGKYANARARIEESLALHRVVGNKLGIAHSLLALAGALIDSQGDPSTVRDLLEESLALSQEVGDKEGIETFYFLSGQLALSQGDVVTAHSLAEKSLMINREIGLREHTVESLSLLAKIEARQGNYAAARVFYEQSLAIMEKGNSKWDIDVFLEGLAGVVAAQGEPAWAARLYGAAEAFRDANSMSFVPLFRAEYERSVAATRAQLGEQAFSAAWNEGRTMTPEQALATEGAVTITPAAPAGPFSVPYAPKASTYPNGLTAREVDVLRLLAKGLTSAQIAEQLVISLLTVNTHVRSIYSKLGVTTRSAATRWAIEHHLV